MPTRITYRSLLILVAIVPAAIGAACNQSASEQHPRTTQQTTAAPATAAPPAVLPGATPAPGAERTADDLHPERVDLSQVTKELLAQSITTYVRSEADRHGGVFAIEDRQQKTQLGDGRYVACVDFKGRDGHTYDIDVFMRPHSEAGFVPTDVLVHKQDGKARFEWVDQHGTCAQMPMTTK
jgi:hypothetical protein